MRDRQLIRILVPHNRTFFFYDGLQPRGLAYEFMTEFVSKLNEGKSTNARVYALFVPLTTERFMSDLEGGYGDVAIAGLSVVEACGRQVDGPERLARFDAHFHGSGQRRVQLTFDDEHDDAGRTVELRNSCAGPATDMDAYVGNLWLPVLPNVRVHADLISHRDSRLGAIVRSGQPQLKTALAEFMRTHGPGTTFGNVLIQRYTRAERRSSGLATTQDARRLRQALPFIRKYAKQYKFDYLLIAAQAYQESRVDQRAKSPEGAIGIMQIKPATASDPNVRIANVDSIESNIHAGVKYLRFVSDRYFNGKQLDELNRHAFAFAAYNAGPARIQELRTTAATEGLDPNVWFDNVEIIAGRKIGPETVDYVRNILRHWVTYHFALGVDEATPPLVAEGRPQRSLQF